MPRPRKAQNSWIPDSSNAWSLSRAFFALLVDHGIKGLTRELGRPLWLPNVEKGDRFKHHGIRVDHGHARGPEELFGTILFPHPLRRSIQCLLRSGVASPTSAPDYGASQGAALRVPPRRWPSRPYWCPPSSRLSGRPTDRTEPRLSGPWCPDGPYEPPRRRPAGIATGTVRGPTPTCSRRRPPTGPRSQGLGWGPGASRAPNQGPLLLISARERNGGREAPENPSAADIIAIRLKSIISFKPAGGPAQVS